MKHVVLTRIIHRDADCIKIAFEKDEVLDRLVRTIKGCRWSKTHRGWYVPERKDIVSELFKQFKEKAYLDYHNLNLRQSQDDDVLLIKTSEEPKLKKPDILPELTTEVQLKVIEFKKWLRSKRYSENTIGTYCDALKIFLRYYSEKSVEEITNADLIDFNNDYVLSNKLSSSFQNQIVNAIKLFFYTIENKQLNPELIHRPKRQKLLPNVLSKEEVKAILNAHNNIKHKAMLSLIYSCGLRCGELLNLKPEHIDSKRKLLIVKQGKGRKDRIAPLSDKIIDMLREYFIACKPEVYLFEGQCKGETYDPRSLQNVLKQGIEKTGIKKPITLHWLRHSYATHLLEAGTDLRYIQEILGHSRSTTTEIYTHVSTKGIQNVISPFDSL